MGRHLYVDADTRQTCLEKPLIECHALYHQICQQIFVSQHGPPRGMTPMSGRANVGCAGFGQNTASGFGFTSVL